MEEILTIFFVFITEVCFSSLVKILNSLANKSIFQISMHHHFIAFLDGYVVSPRKKSLFSQYAFLYWKP